MSIKHSIMALVAFTLCTACDPLLTIEPNYLFEPCEYDTDCNSSEMCVEHAEHDRRNADATCREPCWDDWECGDGMRCGDLNGELVCLLAPEGSSTGE